MYHLIFHELARPAGGFLLSAAGSATLYFAQISDSLPPQARGWLEGGGTVGLILGLAFAVLTLWKDNKDLREKAEALSKEMRDDWKQMNDRLSAAVEKLEDK